MAYIDRHSTKNRAPILVAIGALHAGIIYALVVGLAGIIPPITQETRTTADNFRLPPTPIPDRPKEDDPKVQPESGGGQSTDNRTASAEGPLIVEIKPLEWGDFPAIGDGSGGKTVDPPPLPPKPILPAKLAVPIGKPGLWVTPNDYPSADLRAEHEGTTRFRLSIGADGKVQGCEIVASSGYASLDRAACAKLEMRGKFVAATDASGAAVPGTYSSAVRWTIPKD